MTNECAAAPQWARKADMENRIWQQEETLPREQLQDLQARRLREVVERVQTVPFYRNALRKSGVSAESIKTVGDIRRLPFTTKEDLRDNYPLNLLAVPRSDLARLHGSSGTTGKPTFVAYTAEDLRTWADMCARFLVAGGLQSHHLVHIAFGYGLFTGGFGLHYGVERVGATVLPVSSGNTPRQIMLLRDLQADVLICTPSYAVNIAEELCDKTDSERPHNLKFAHFGGEPWTEDMRAEIERAFGIYAFDNYGPERGHRARRQWRVPVPQRDAHPGGPFPRRMPRPGHARTRAVRRVRRVGLHHAHEAGHARDPLPHP